MDYKDKVKYSNTPVGQIVHAFTMENILFQDEKQIMVRDPLLHPYLIKAVGTRYVVQKNRRNGQVIWYSRDATNPSFCPVVRALSLVHHTVILGRSPSDPICVYRDTINNTVYLTGTVITKYFQYVTKLIYPDIDETALAAISSHFFLQKLVCQYILLNYANVGLAIVLKFIFKTHYAWQTSVILGLNLVSGEDEDEGFLDDYDLEDDD